MITLLLWTALKIFYVFRRVSPGTSNFDKWSVNDIIIFCVIYIPTKAFFYYLVYLNCNIISFKNYIRDIYYGFRVVEMYPKASVFLKISWLKKTNLTETKNLMVTISENLDSFCSDENSVAKSESDNWINPYKEQDNNYKSNYTHSIYLPTPSNSAADTSKTAKS